MEQNRLQQKTYDVRPEFQNADALCNAAYYNKTGEPPAKLFSRKDFYKIWFINNSCILHFADKSITINQPALIFSNPLIPYAYEGLGKQRSGYWCIFKEEFLKLCERVKSIQQSPLFNISEYNIFFLDDLQTKNVCFLFENIISELNSAYKYKFDEIKSYINLLIHVGLKAQPVHFPQQTNGSVRITYLFLDLLEKQFPITDLQQPLCLKAPGDFASSLGIHVNHLNHVVKTITGKTTSTHIAEKIVYEAKALIKHTDWNISETGYALGFSYPNHFNNFFKKHTGYTPTAYRMDI